MQSTANPINIDGSQGEGGGQILRTALSLSMLSGRPLLIENIRAGRAKPGLMRQHLVCVKAAQMIAGAVVSGAELGASALAFTPSGIFPGHVALDIGTSGSCTLVLQTVLPALLQANGAASIRITGGTHTMLAPISCFLQRSFLPVLLKMAAKLTIDVEKYGLFPAGGGVLVAKFEPSQLRPFDLAARGELIGVYAEAIGANMQAEILQREARLISQQLQINEANVGIRDAGSHTGPGNVLSAWAQYENVTELVQGFGARGKRAEAVVNQLCRELQDYQSSKAVVGEHLADQLLLPMLLAGGGRFITGAPSLHTRTNIEVIEQVTGAKFRCVEVSKGRWEISLAPYKPG